MPPPNLTAETAIDITPLLYENTQDVNDGGTTHVVWYKYTAQPGDNEIGFFFFGDETTYKPTTSVRSPNSTTLYKVTEASTKNTPFHMPVTPGQTYWFRVTSSTGNVASAILHVRAERFVDQAVPPGTIAINEDKTGFPTAFISTTTGAILKYQPNVGSGKYGARLNDGTVLLENADNGSITQVDLYDPVMNHVKNIQLLEYEDAAIVGSNKVDKFFVGLTSDENVDFFASISRYSKAGDFEQRWALPDGGMHWMDVNGAGSIAYYTKQQVGAVLRFNLATGTAMSDFVPVVSGRGVFDILVLADDTVLLLYDDVAASARKATNVTVEHRSTDGTLLHTYEFGDIWEGRLASANDDPNSFWIYRKPSPGGLTGITGEGFFTNVKVSDGSYLKNLGPVYLFPAGVYRISDTTPPAYFGIPTSCPFWLTGEPPEEEEEDEEPHECLPTCDDGPSSPGGMSGGGSGAAGGNQGGVGNEHSIHTDPEVCEHYDGPWGTTEDHPDPVAGELLKGKRTLDLWIALHHKDYPSGVVTTYRRALAEIRDDQGRRVEAALLNIGTIEHGLGNERGTFESGKVSIEFSDAVSRFIRTLAEEQDLEGDELEIYMESPEARAAALPPRVLLRVVVERLTLDFSLRATILAADALFAAVGPFTNRRPWPWWTFGDIFDEHSGCPPDVRKITIAALYGIKSDECARDPITNEPAAKGLLPLHFVGRPLAGYGFLAGGLMPWFKWLGVYGSDLANVAPADETETPAHRPAPTRVRLDMDGGDILVPGHAGWPHATTYVPFTAPDGRVFWLSGIYVKEGPLLDAHLKGEINITANAVGLEHVGDGSGLPLIDAGDVEHHWIENFLMLDKTNGLWCTNADAPRWPDGTYKVRTSRFKKRQAFTKLHLGDRGLTVGWWAGEAQSVEAWFDEWNDSTETQLGENGFGQVTLGWLDAAISPSTWPRVNHQIDIFGPVRSTHKEQRENFVIGSCDYDPDTDTYRVGPQKFSSEEGIAINKGRIAKRDRPIDSRILRHEAHHSWVLRLRLARLHRGVVPVEIVGKVDLLDIDVDDPGIQLTTIQGTGSAGYVDRPMRLMRRGFAIAPRLVTYALIDSKKALFATAIVGGYRPMRVTNDTSLAPAITNDDTLAPLVIL